MPGTGILGNLSRAERIPVKLVTLGTAVLLDELPQGNLLASAGQFNQRIKCSLGKRLVLSNILNGARRHLANVDAIEGVVAVRAVTSFQARLPILEAGATFGLTSAFTSASQWLHGLMWSETNGFQKSVQDKKNF
mgnify:FL=1